MAKVIKAEKPLLLIGCTARELMDTIHTDVAVCDWCGRMVNEECNVVYIAVLNQWFSQKCYEEWIKMTKYYPEDADIERKNFEFYAPRFGLTQNTD